jgi:phosphonate transport system substrate-binding protein
LISIKKRPQQKPEKVNQGRINLRIPMSKLQIIRLLFGLTLALISLQACDSGTTPKNVSITSRADTKETSSKKSDEQEVLKFGFDLRLDPKDDFKIYMPFLQYLTETTGLKFSIVFTADYEETIKNLGAGVTQFAFLGPLNGIRAKKLYGTGCLAMGKNSLGRKEYQGAIITRPESDLSDLTDLKGRSFAFGSRFSTQGHLIARFMLEQAGLSLGDLSIYEYTGSHENAMRAILNGAFDAAAVQDSLARKMSALGKVKILSMSAPFPASLACFNGNVDASIVTKVKQALMDFDPQGAHAKILVDWNTTEMPAGFAPYEDSRLDSVRDLAQRYGLLE